MGDLNKDELYEHLLSCGVQEEVCAALRDQSVDGAALALLDDDTLREEFGLTQWGLRRAVLRCQHRLQHPDEQTPPTGVEALDVDALGAKLVELGLCNPPARNRDRPANGATEQAAVLAALRAQGVDGQAFLELDDAVLREHCRIEQWGRRCAVLRLQQQLRDPAHPRLPAACCISVEEVLRRLARQNLTPADRDGQDAIAFVEEHELDGAAIAEMDKDTPAGAARVAALKVVGEGRSVCKWGIQAKILKVGKDLRKLGEPRPAAPDRLRPPRPPSSVTSSRIGPQSVRDGAAAQAVSRVLDYRSAWPRPDAEVCELSPHPAKARECAGAGADEVEQLAQRLLGLAVPGAAEWRNFLKDADFEESDLVDAAQRRLCGHRSSHADPAAGVAEGASPPRGDEPEPPLPAPAGPAVALRTPADGGEEEEEGEARARSIKDMSPHALCRVRGVNAIAATREGASDASESVGVPCFLRAKPGEALIGGARFVHGSRGQLHVDRKLLLRRGAHGIVFAKCEVQLGPTGADSVCAVTNCLFYDCKVTLCVSDRHSRRGTVQVYNSVFIRCKWTPHAFSDWIARRNVFLNSTLLFRNRSTGDLIDNIAVVQRQMAEGGFIEKQQSSQGKCENNLFRGPLDVLRRLFRADTANAYDVLPCSALLRVPWDALQDPAVLSEGNFGVVYRARHTTMAITMAVKELRQDEDYCGAARPRDGPSPRATGRAAVDKRKDAVEKMVNEIEMMRRLTKLPNLVTIYGCGMDNGRVFMCMELAEHGCLNHLLRSRAQPSTSAWLQMLHDVAAALWLIHSKPHCVVHLDCRSANVFVTAEGLLKLGDFGIAVSEHSPVRTFPVLYTDPALFPTEDGHCKRALTAHDVWSLGVLAWEMLQKGSVPYGDGPATGRRVDRIKRGERLSCPHSFSQNLWDEIAAPCFRPIAGTPARPTAQGIAEALQRRLDSAPEESSPGGTPRDTLYGAVTYASLVSVGSAVSGSTTVVSPSRAAVQSWIHSAEEHGRNPSVDTEFDYHRSGSSLGLFSVEEDPSTTDESPRR
eukprot:TRINITY_DN16825_c0_g1_i1.p1 TRINITY_DN16825_c0_g1~~TRINITY_DN16825_c0_g1_i1.p1  ORF type:complete len:1041 (+),score=313.24 TRINITY_DN16825_c0_g1_i1:96-3218(+)